jgi:hypothetical protein
MEGRWLVMGGRNEGRNEGRMGREGRKEGRKEGRMVSSSNRGQEEEIEVRRKDGRTEQRKGGGG